MSLAHSEDPDELSHKAAFHHSLHCLLGQKLSSEKKIQYHLEIKNYYNLQPLGIYNGPFHVYCIKPKGRIH